MHKIVIVEDDRIIRRSLCKVPWEEYGIVVAGEAENGEVALPIIEREQPSVVISDINMPFLDGLEMAKIVKEKSPSTRIVFLTGYDEFKYAQEAVKLRAFDYLLKPVKREELVQKVLEACRDWEREEKAKDKLSNTETLMQEKLFSKFLQYYEKRQIIDVEEELAKLDIRLLGPYYTTLLINIPASSEGEDQEMKEAVRRIASEHVCCADGNILPAGFNETVLFLSVENANNEEKEKMAQLLLTELERETNRPVTITMGRTYPDIFELASSYVEAKLAMNMQILANRRGIYSIDDTVKSQSKGLEILNELDRQLEEQIKMGLVAKAKETVCHFRKALGSELLSLTELKMFAVKFMTLLSYEKDKQKNAGSEIDITDNYKKITESENPNDLFRILEEMIDDWSASVKASAEKMNYSVVDEAMEYMKDHYQDPGLTLQKIAKIVHVSAPYLSNVFRQEKGMNFSEYLLKLRMEKAMELFRGKEEKTYEVAEKVGFNNPQYFSSCFKKYTGYSPKEYKNLAK